MRKTLFILLHQKQKGEKKGERSKINTTIHAKTTVAVDWLRLTPKVCQPFYFGGRLKRKQKLITRHAYQNEMIKAEKSMKEST